MKKIIFFILLAVVLGGCSSNEDKSDKNVAVIEKYVQAVENLDFEIMGEMLDDSYVGIGPSYDDAVDKTGAIVNWKFNVENLYKSIEYSKSKSIAINIESGENKGEWVSNWAELTIVFKSEEDVTILANTIYQLKNGKIVKSFTFYNEADVLEQLGMVFVNANSL